MTAGELIAQLQNLPSDTPVLVEGYETGFDEAESLMLQKVIRYRRAQAWDGEYQSPDRFSVSETAVIEAAVIKGRRGSRR